MSNIIKDGGPAFPSEPKALITQPDGTTVAVGHYGMTLRDWFAGMALAGMLAREVAPPLCTAVAYDYADTMIAERNKK